MRRSVVRTRDTPEFKELHQTYIKNRGLPDLLPTDDHWRVLFEDTRTCRRALGYGRVANDCIEPNKYSDLRLFLL